MSLTAAVGLKHSKTGKYLVIEDPKPHVNGDLLGSSKVVLTFLSPPYVTIHQVSGNPQFNGKYLTMEDNGDLSNNSSTGSKAEFLYSPSTADTDAFFLSKVLDPDDDEVHFVAFEDDGKHVVRTEFSANNGYFQYSFHTFRPEHKELQTITEWWESRDPSIDSKYTNWPVNNSKTSVVAMDSKITTESPGQDEEKVLGSIQLDESSEPGLIDGTTE